jgi:flagellar motility protein MotE (MotC chaperone)
MSRALLITAALLIAGPALGQSAPDPQAAPVIETPASGAPICEGTEELLLAISRERDLLGEIRAGIDRERAELDLVREAVRQETDRLTALRAELGGVLERLVAGEEAELARLVAVYEAMKPEEAARLLDGLDMSVTMLIFSTMQERRAGPILARMSPVRAQAISRILIEMAKLPEDRNLEGIRLR